MDSCVFFIVSSMFFWSGEHHLSWQYKRSSQYQRSKIICDKSIDTAVLEEFV